MRQAQDRLSHFSSAITDLDHYHGRGGRVFPLWADRQQRTPNLKAGLVSAVAEALGVTVSASDLMAYFAAIARILRTRHVSAPTLSSRACASR